MKRSKFELGLTNSAQLPPPLLAWLVQWIERCVRSSQSRGGSKGGARWGAPLIFRPNRAPFPPPPPPFPYLKVRIWHCKDQGSFPGQAWLFQPLTIGYLFNLTVKIILFSYLYPQFKIRYESFHIFPLKKKKRKWVRWIYKSRNDAIMVCITSVEMKKYWSRS